MTESRWNNVPINVGLEDFIEVWPLLSLHCRDKGDSRRCELNSNAIQTLRLVKAITVIAAMIIINIIIMLKIILYGHHYYLFDYVEYIIQKRQEWFFCRATFENGLSDRIIGHNIFFTSNVSSFVFVNWNVHIFHVSSFNTRCGFYVIFKLKSYDLSTHNDATQNWIHIIWFIPWFSFVVTFTAKSHTSR